MIIDAFKGNHFKEILFAPALSVVRNGFELRHFYCYDYIIFANINHFKKQLHAAKV